MGCKSIDVNVEVQQRTNFRQVAVVGQITSQKTVDAFPAIFEVDAHVGDQQQIGLSRLNEHARWHSAFMHIPSRTVDVGFGADGCMRPQYARFGIDGHHPIAEQEGRGRHADLSRK